MKAIKYWLFLFLVAGMTAGCDLLKNDEEEEEEEQKMASPLTLKINTFIKEVMTDVYLWYDKMPSIDEKYETDSKAYFDKLLYSEDKWSFITDDIKSFENSTQGIEKTFGYSLAFGAFSNAPGTYFAIVEYVYPNTPASKAGFNRGDLIVKINGGNITADNYRSLLSGTDITVTKGVLSGSGISQGISLSMVAEELNLDPVLMYKIIEREGHKIGYMLYLQFISSYNGTSVSKALQHFRDNQVTDLVLDLRYNPGGETTAAQYICSSIAPQSVVENKSMLVSYQWNNKYQAYWISKKRDDQLGVYFDPTVPVKLGLSKIHILTGNNTASASELTITGLEPYLDVVLVGDTTYGKYTGSFTIKPSEWYDKPSDYTDFENWGMQPIIIRFANSQGVTNFTNGFAPDFVVGDALLPAYPLGDLSEPLLKKAVENITGKTISAMKKAQVSFQYEIIDRGFSRFDPLKRNLFIGNLRDIPRSTADNSSVR
jgi:C-terminal processing protease CtpA/Prc